MHILSKMRQRKRTIRQKGCNHYLETSNEKYRLQLGRMGRERLLL